MNVPCVIYAAKSSEDIHGSIDTQIEDGRRLAAARELTVDEPPVFETKRSAYHGNRGPELESAMRRCEALATTHGRCVLIVQHSDRLARGDAKQARHLIEVVLWAIKSNVELLSVQDPEMLAGGDLTILMGAIGGMRNHEDSKRKSLATRDGLSRRINEGKPVGAIPFGYRHQDLKDETGEVVRDKKGKPITERVEDSNLAPKVVESFGRVADHQTLGTVARGLNAQGIKTRQGTPFTARTIRLMIRNTAYIGEKGYPAIVTTTQFKAARDALKRRDPVAVQRGKGGRKPKRPYLLRSVVFCAKCEAPMYSSEAYSKREGGSYVCSNKLQNTGLCRDAHAVPADVLEKHVLNHLRTFVGSIETWITERVRDRDVEAAVRQQRLDADRAQLAVLDRQREERMAEIREHGITSPLAMEVVEMIDRDREVQARRIQETEAMLSEWEDAPDVDAVHDYYDRLVEAVLRRIDSTDEVEQLNETLCSVLAGLWVEVEPDRERLLVEFALKRPTYFRDGDGTLRPLEDQRRYLPPVRFGYQPVEPLGAEVENPTVASLTGSQTTVSACLP
jgi:DNA invertase Pin-like site-specific DNA recombinase